MAAAAFDAKLMNSEGAAVCVSFTDICPELTPAVDDTVDKSRLASCELGVGGG